MKIIFNFNVFYPSVIVYKFDFSTKLRYNQPRECKNALYLSTSIHHFPYNLLISKYILSRHGGLVVWLLRAKQKIVGSNCTRTYWLDISADVFNLTAQALIPTTEEETTHKNLYYVIDSCNS